MRHGGWSMVGYEAVSLSEDHAEMVGSVSAMERAGIPHHYEIVPGRHKMTTVLAAWPKVLAFHREIWK